MSIVKRRPERPGGANGIVLPLGELEVGGVPIVRRDQANRLTGGRLASAIVICALLAGCGGRTPQPANPPNLEGSSPASSPSEVANSTSADRSPETSAAGCRPAATLQMPAELTRRVEMWLTDPFSSVDRQDLVERVAAWLSTEGRAIPNLEGIYYDPSLGQEGRATSEHRSDGTVRTKVHIGGPAARSSAAYFLSIMLHEREHAVLHAQDPDRWLPIPAPATAVMEQLQREQEIIIWLKHITVFADEVGLSRAELGRIWFSLNELYWSTAPAAMRQRHQAEYDAAEAFVDSLADDQVALARCGQTSPHACLVNDYNIDLQLANGVLTHNDMRWPPAAVPVPKRPLLLGDCQYVWLETPAPIEDPDNNAFQVAAYMYRPPDDVTVALVPEPGNYICDSRPGQSCRPFFETVPVGGTEGGIGYLEGTYGWSACLEPRGSVTARWWLELDGRAWYPEPTREGQSDTYLVVSVHAFIQGGDYKTACRPGGPNYLGEAQTWPDAIVGTAKTVLSGSTLG